MLETLRAVLYKIFVNAGDNVTPQYCAFSLKAHDLNIQTHKHNTEGLVFNSQRLLRFRRVHKFILDYKY